MAEMKTKETGENVEKFLTGVADPARREDSFAVLELMREASKEEPKMWGPSIVGFGNQHYRYESGREGDWFTLGFSPRKEALTLYLSGGLEPHAPLLERLGKHKTGKGCLYIKKLSDVDIRTLRTLLEETVARAAKG
jgi:hypothetical protein